MCRPGVKSRGFALLMILGCLSAGEARAADPYGYGYGEVPASPCGYWPHNLAENWLNTPYYNFGCASSHNLAAMVEDPRDLYVPRPMTPRDSVRRDAIYQKYRSGTDTSANSGTENAATVSGE